MTEVEMAKEWGIKDIHKAKTNFWIRQRTGRSTFSHALHSLVNEIPLNEEDLAIKEYSSTLVLDDAPIGLRDGKEIIGYLGLVGNVPVTQNGKLVMWSCLRGNYVSIAEPKMSIWNKFLRFVGIR